MGYRIIFLSGRTAGCHRATTDWLYGYFGDNWEELYMRPVGDNRKDSVVKMELFDKYVRNRYDVRYVLDDRNQVVEMWRSLGLTVLQVADGNF
jgi:hypothetical protein